jgi:hypothetical protein
MRALLYYLLSLLLAVSCGLSCKVELRGFSELVLTVASTGLGLWTYGLVN